MTKEVYKQACGAALVGSVCTAMFVLGFHALADQNAGTDTVPRQFPYHGTLERDGSPVTATGDDALWMRIDLLDGDPTQGEPGVLYSQSAQVEVFAGRFTVLLGDNNDPTWEGVFSGDDTPFLQLTMLGEHNQENPESTAGDDVTMPGAQRFALAPYAVWATRATRFDVARDVVVNGPARVNQLSAQQAFINRVTRGSVSAGSITATRLVATAANANLTGNVTMGAANRSTNHDFDSINVTGSGSGHLLTITDGGSNRMEIDSDGPDTNTTLQINDSTVRDVQVTAPLSVGGALNTAGQLTTTGDVDLGTNTLTVSSGSARFSPTITAGSISSSNASLGLQGAVTVNGNATVDSDITIVQYLKLPRNQSGPAGCLSGFGGFSYFYNFGSNRWWCVCSKPSGSSSSYSYRGVDNYTRGCPGSN